MDWPRILKLAARGISTSVEEALAMSVSRLTLPLPNSFSFKKMVYSKARSFTSKALGF